VSAPDTAPLREPPRTSRMETLRAVASQGGGRIDMRSRLERLYARHGNVVVQQIGAWRMVNLFGPDANRLVLLDRDRIFSAKRPWDMIMGRIFPNGLLLRDGEDHKHHRKIMHLAFKRPALREYAERMAPMIQRTLADWPARAEDFSAFRAFKALTLDMAAALFVGVDLGPASVRLNRAFEDMVAASMSRMRLPLPFLEFGRGLRGRAFMIDYFSDLLPKKRAVGGRDMLSRLCHAVTEEGERFEDREIVDHMIFLMMAAHDTTTSTLTSLAYELARNPGWQDRIRQESLAFGPEPGFDDLDSLPSLTWAVRETLRRYPPLPVIPRTSTRAFEWDGYRIPDGVMVVVSPIHTHHMEEWWCDPDRWDPERFSPVRAEHERHSHCWVPFGGGPHMCIGRRVGEAQVRLIMHHLVRRHRWRVPDGYRMPVQQAPISKPTDGLPLELEPLQ
jgi:cytochrome P450